MMSLVGGEAFGCHMEGEVLRSFDGRELEDDVTHKNKDGIEFSDLIYIKICGVDSTAARVS